jgi:predicted ABC-type ATPase
MNTKMLVVLLGGLVLVSGCVKTVNDRHAFALSPGKDKFENRYKRTVDVVYAAAVDVIKANGTISRESVINPGPTAVKTIEAKVNGQKVWVRVQAVDSDVTSVQVQVRTSAGGTDLTLTQQLQNQIGIKLASG